MPIARLIDYMPSRQCPFKNIMQLLCFFQIRKIWNWNIKDTQYKKLLIQNNEIKSKPDKKKCTKKNPFKNVILNVKQINVIGLQNLHFNTILLLNTKR